MSIAPEILRRAREIAGDVPDPEMPVLTLADLGVVRDVVVEGGELTVLLTPTYTACPATEVIGRDIVGALEREGLRARVRICLSPAWSSDWISDRGRERLHAFGIAPPARSESGVSLEALHGLEPSPACPRCGSRVTSRISAHGSTPCKALWRCVECREPFDHFKTY